MTAQRWPTAWLMTDERLGNRVEEAIARAAAAGAGVLVRHYGSSPASRQALGEMVLGQGATLGIARDVGLARALGADLVHNPAVDPGDMPFSLAVHDAAQAFAARNGRASLVFVSPLFATASHPDATPLGEAGALALALMTRKPAIALGGMTASEGERLMKLGWAGWAGIDAWS